MMSKNSEPQTLTPEDSNLVQSTTQKDAVADASSTAENSNGNQDSKREFSVDEETLIIRMYNLVGERWHLIAGRIPGRNAEEIEKYWNSRHSASE